MKENLEIEAKFLLTDVQYEDIRKVLKNIENAEEKPRVYEKTIMFDNNAKSMFAEDARLRVRLISENKESNNKKIEFSYKRRIGVIDGIKHEEEIECEFETNDEKFVQVLNKMGYTMTTSYERYRETIFVKSCKVTLDEFPFGFILEIEGDVDEIKILCKEMNLDLDNAYVYSCDDVYIDLCKKNNISPKDHINFGDSEMPHL